MREQRTSSSQRQEQREQAEEPEELDELDWLFLEHLPRIDPPPHIVERILTIARQPHPPRQPESDQPTPLQDGKSGEACQGH
jgi:hypothetical protein